MSGEFDRRSKMSSYRERPSFDQLAQGHQRTSSYGYNANSFATPSRQEPLRPGRDEEELINGSSSPLHQEDDWDVYADFNNAGPRFATGLNTPPTFSSVDAKGYRQLPNTKSESGAEPDVELVTVPAFGAEWAKDELRGMTKGGRKKDRAERRGDIWKAWTRGEHGFCGGVLTRRALVFFLFGLCVVVGVVLAICIPRVPGFAFNSNAPLVPVAPPDGVPDTPARYINAFSRTPANFSFDSWIDLQVNTHGNILPLHFNSIRAQVYETTDFNLVATGNLTGVNVKAKSSIPLLFPLKFEYQAVNASDPTWLRFYDACNNHVNHPNGQRPGIDIRIVIEMYIRGLVTRAATSTQISGVACPIELPTNSA